MNILRLLAIISSVSENLVSSWVGDVAPPAKIKKPALPKTYFYKGYP
jgi:hypothetical protein